MKQEFQKKSINLPRNSLDFSSQEPDAPLPWGERVFVPDFFWGEGASVHRLSQHAHFTLGNRFWGPDPLGSSEQCENGYNDLLDGTRLLPLLPSKPRPHPPPESLLKVNPLSVFNAGSHYLGARPQCFLVLLSCYDVWWFIGANSDV